MGLLARLKNISTGKLMAFLDEAERPEEMIPQLLNELYNQQHALRNAEAKSLAAVRNAQRRMEETMGRALRLERGAELALKKGEEDTAREALREQIKVENNLPQQRKQVEQAQTILDDVRERGNALIAQIDALKEKRDQLNAIPPPPAPPPSSKPLLDQVAKIEEHIVAKEAELEAHQEVYQRKRSLDERLLELERNEEIEKRLNHIRKEQDHDG